MAESKPSISIKVEPPAAAQRGVELFPPLVVGAAGDRHDIAFVQITLVDAADGNIVDSYMSGGLSANMSPLDDNNNNNNNSSGSSKSGGSSSSSVDYAVFPGLSILVPGSYVIRAYEVGIHETSDGVEEAEMGSWVDSRVIHVSETPVATGVPGSRERTLLRRLRQSGGHLTA